MSPRDAPRAEAPIGAIRPDARDLRDRFYEPALAPLAARLDPPAALLAAIARGTAGLPRDQGAEGSCGGHALAALIDTERLRAAPVMGPMPAPVSARMIQTMAVRHDASGLEASAGVSLRDVIKGFYNYGVCPEEAWRYAPNDADRTITPDRAKAAREVALGAYFRLRPNLNLYHSALREAGAVLVSAELHQGWSLEAEDACGRIPRPVIAAPSAGPFSGGHAFVLVGYDEDGFLLLNSWGPGWGGFPVAGAPRLGIAHWSYGDWADAVMDGWALRLGVRAPEAFEFSIGDMGLGIAGPAFAGRVRQARAAPVRVVLGHYLHLDDGDYVERGAYASDRASVEETFKLIAADARAGDARRYRGLLLTFAGGLLNLGDAAAQIAQLKAELWKDREETGRTWYPLTALWCVDYVEEARAVLEGVFAQALAQAGKPGPELDRLIEARAHGVGRALWRDIRCAAERASRPKGPFRDLLDAAAGVAAIEPGFGLRVFAEGEGAFALAELVEALAGDAQRARAFYRMLRSVDIVAPPMPSCEFTGLAARIAAGWRAADATGRLRLHLTAAEDEPRLAVPPYGKSYFDLVAAAFLPRRLQRAAPARGRRPPKGIAPRWSPWLGPRVVEARAIRWRDWAAPPSTERILQSDLIHGSDVIGRVRAALAGDGPQR